MLEKIFTPLVIIFGYIIWETLDYFKLANSVAILLIIFVIITGIAYFYHKNIVIKRQNKEVELLEKRGHKITPEELKTIKPDFTISGELGASFKILLIIVLFRSFLYEPFIIPSGSMEPTLRIGDLVLVNKYAYGIKDPIWQKTLIPISHPKRGDIIVFKAPTEPTVDYVKRVIGIEGDTITVANNGEITLTPACQDDCTDINFSYTTGVANPDYIYYNNAQIEKTETGSVTHQILQNPQNLYLDPYLYTQQGLPVGTWKVPKGHYFAMGDNRDNSADSRFWGFIPEDALVGKAVRVALSFDKQAGEWPSGIRTERTFLELK